MDKELYFNRLKENLSIYYDLDESLSSEYGSIDLYAKYFEKNDRYILSKKSVIYSQEAFEHIFCKYFENITLEYVKDFTNFLETNITNFVKPNDDHMSSIIRGVIVTNEEPSDEIINFIKKYKYYKSFLFGFKGWVNIGLNLVDINNRDNFYHNKVGKNGRDYFKI
ncbi:hypothetical protein ABID14_000934 [Peptoniphilus olsenii]|uniref:DUF8052 domain-containing protein n=1 Tax=Peptoniphilus olsenii TaxID=411570 RepID=A0ABV2J943_9FIRM